MQVKENENYKSEKEQILNLVFEEANSVMTLAEAKIFAEFIIEMVVGSRRRDLLKKIKVCKHYKRLKEKEMPGRQIRSIIARRYDIKWNRMGAACEPCKRWIGLKK